MTWPLNGNGNGSHGDRVITLSTQAQYIARYMGQQRMNYARGAGLENRKVSTDDDLTIDVEGYGAELATCLWWNLCPDFDVGLGRADCERWGRSIDVKTTKHADGKLIYGVHKAVLAADLFVLWICYWPAYRFAGWASKGELCKPERILTLKPGRPPVYAMRQDVLFEHWAEGSDD